MAEPSGLTQLLQTPELMESIFLELDHRELLCRIPLVCRFWRDIIATSPRLQARLFFRPIGTSWALDHAVKPEQNPQVWKQTWKLQDLFQAKEKDVDAIRAGQEKTLDPQDVEPAPSVAPTTPRSPGFPRSPGCPKSPKAPVSPSASSCKTKMGLQDKVSGITASTHAAPYSFMGPWQDNITSPEFTRPGVSWRKMLIQQPAIHSFGQVIVRKRLNGSIETKVGKIDFPDGIRMGHVWDALRESMVLLKSDMCLMRLVWWEPTITSFEKALYPMAQDVSRLFEEGAQLVLAIGFSECHPQDRFYGKFASEYESLCHCEEFDPPRFNFQETVSWPGAERRHSLA